MQSKNAPYCTIGFQDMKLRLIGIPLVAFIMPIAFFNVDPIERGSVFWFSFLITLIHVFAFWHMDRGIVIFFRKKLPYYQQYGKRLTLQILTVIFFTLLVEKISFFFLSKGVWETYLGGITRPSEGQFLLATFFITTVIMAIYESMYAFDMWSLGIADNERLKKENVKAQLETLKNQVNPHFLFNSLNTLAALIPEDSDLAVEYVEKLSKVYRFVLEIKDKKLITLEEELEAIRAYNFLLQIRFGENIQFSIDISSSKSQLLVVPLSIQMLIENAVKHNVISNKKPLFVKIYLEDDYVVIQNNLQQKTGINNSTKTGLMNIQKRYDLLSDKKTKIMSDNQFFVVKLPLLSVEAA